MSERRQAYAREIGAVAGLADAAPVLDALRQVPREATLGPGPWTLQVAPLREATTRDAEPHRVLHNLAVQLPSGRWQAAPAQLALLVDSLAPRPGERVLVIGHDAAYAAELVAWLSGRPASVRELAADALGTANAVPCGDAEAGFDALLLLAGCSRPPWAWLERLRGGGRAVFPLLGMEGTALYWQVERPVSGARWPARTVTLGEAVAWEDAGEWAPNEAAVADALAHWLLDVKSLLRSADDGEDMMLVFDEGCFSRRAVDTHEVA